MPFSVTADDYQPKEARPPCDPAFIEAVRKLREQGIATDKYFHSKEDNVYEHI